MQNGRKKWPFHLFESNIKKLTKMMKKMMWQGLIKALKESSPKTFGTTMFAIAQIGIPAIDPLYEVVRRYRRSSWIFA